MAVTEPADAKRSVQVPFAELGFLAEVFDRQMKRLFLAGGILMTLAMVSPARADLKIAYVDVQRALNECDSGKKAKGEFRAKIERLEERLSKQQQEVEALKGELEKKGMLMKEDERRNLQDEYERKAKDFERDYQDSKQELEKSDNEVTGGIVRDIARVIRSIGEKDNFTLVFEKGSILWGAQSIDITDEVIRTYNALGPRVSSLEDAGGQETAGATRGSSFGDAAAKHSTISK
jgi:outer membrane protein